MNAKVRDVMTGEVVAVRKGASFKEMAARLRQYRVSAFPVIDENRTRKVKRLPVVDAGGYLVGIVSRADLLTVFDRTDEEIHSEIVNDLILRDFLIDPAVFIITVVDGVVTIKGNPETADLGHNLVARIRRVQGVVAVDDELAYPPPERSVVGLYF